MSNKPHKYADVIKAWADGAEIQVRDPNFSNPTWTDCNPSNPGWHFADLEFRVKPKNKVRYVPVIRLPNSGFVVGHGVTEARHAKGQVREDSELLNTVRMEFDADGNLVSCYTEEV